VNTNKIFDFNLLVRRVLHDEIEEQIT